MNKVSAIYKETVQQLRAIYDKRESESIVNLLFEDLLEISKTKRLTNDTLSLSEEQSETLRSSINRLLNHEPVQQVIGFTYFYGIKLHVNTHVLSPRPETEELVDLIIKENDKPGLSVLDIGTGSGCIAIALSKNLPAGRMSGWDISDEALKTARQNASSNGVTIHFEKVDILKTSRENQFDIIISNPPYIPDSEKKSMHQNVVNFEPEVALFVPDNDPLRYYRRIAKYATDNLKDRGKLYFEIHERFGKEVKQLLDEMDFSEVAILKDMQGKDRMIRALH